MNRIRLMSITILVLILFGFLIAGSKVNAFFTQKNPTDIPEVLVSLDADMVEYAVIVETQNQKLYL